jgi:hypothetical protein
MKEAPASGMAKASGSNVCSAADILQIHLRTTDFQNHHLRQRYGLPAATAAAIADLAFARSDSWRSAR